MKIFYLVKASSFFFSKGMDKKENSYMEWKILDYITLDESERGK